MMYRINSSAPTGWARTPGLFGALLLLFAVSVASIGRPHWYTWECNLPPRISGAFACFTTLDV